MSPHPRDAEYAAALTDDGHVDPAWANANTRTPQDDPDLPAGAIALACFPWLATPGTIARLTADGYPQRTIRQVRRRGAIDQARYPQLWARMVELGV